MTGRNATPVHIGALAVAPPARSALERHRRAVVTVPCTSLFTPLRGERHQATVDDAALTALTAARGKATSQHHGIAALDRDHGALTTSPQRTGLIFRCPVHPDAPTAEAALPADRADLAAKGRILAQRTA